MAKFQIYEFVIGGGLFYYFYLLSHIVWVYEVLKTSITPISIL